MHRASVIVIACLVFLAAACSGSSDRSAEVKGSQREADPTQVAPLVRGTASASSFGDTARASAASNSSSSASASSGSSKGSLALTGAVSGTLNIMTAACAAAGTQSISLSGSLSGVVFGLNVRATSSGDFTFGPGAQQGTVPTAQLTDQSPTSSGKTWSAGFQQAAGTGTITVNPDNSGSIDADMAASTGAGGTVHVRGSWTC